MSSDATYGTKEQSERMNAFYEEVRDTKPIAELLAGAMPIARESVSPLVQLAQNNPSMLPDIIGLAMLIGGRAAIATAQRQAKYTALVESFGFKEGM